MKIEAGIGDNSQRLCTTPEHKKLLLSNIQQRRHDETTTSSKWRPCNSNLVSLLSQNSMSYKINTYLVKSNRSTLTQKRETKFKVKGRTKHSMESNEGCIFGLAEIKTWSLKITLQKKKKLPVLSLCLSVQMIVSISRQKNYGLEYSPNTTKKQKRFLLIKYCSLFTICWTLVKTETTFTLPAILK